MLSPNALHLRIKERGFDPRIYLLVQDRLSMILCSLDLTLAQRVRKSAHHAGDPGSVPE